MLPPGAINCLTDSGRMDVTADVIALSIVDPIPCDGVSGNPCCDALSILFAEEGSKDVGEIADERVDDDDDPLPLGNN